MTVEANITSDDQNITLLQALELRIQELQTFCEETESPENPEVGFAILTLDTLRDAINGDGLYREWITILLALTLRLCPSNLKVMLIQE